jgi:hypothetical protein
MKFLGMEFSKLNVILLGGALLFLCIRLFIPAEVYIKPYGYFASTSEEKELMKIARQCFPESKQSPLFHVVRIGEGDDEFRLSKINDGVLKPVLFSELPGEEQTMSINKTNIRYKSKWSTLLSDHDFLLLYWEPPNSNFRCTWCLYSDKNDEGAESRLKQEGEYMLKKYTTAYFHQHEQPQS